jgi:hypothetical protein
MPSKRVFTAALTSLSLGDPHASHTQCLTEIPAQPRGPDRLPHEEQVIVELCEAISAYRIPPARHLYSIIDLNCAWPLEATLFPNFFAIPLMLSLLKTIRVFSCTSRSDSLWFLSFL